ncbi:MAG: hypothetical protein Q9208_005489 [Pyrenodesmia sp. 3 TL-2023]
MARIEASFEHALDMTPNQPDMDSSVPAWFLENCVKIVQDLTECGIPLVVRENLALEHGRNQETNELDAEVYEVDSDVYEPLQRLLLPKTSDMVDEHPSDLLPTRRFLKDSVHLHLPDPTGGSHFLTAVVERFASEAGADIVTLVLDDVNVLFDRHALTCCPLAGIDGDIYGTTGEQSERHGHTLDENESRQIKEAQIAKATNFSLTVLLSSPGIKRAKRQIQNSMPEKAPFILYLPKVKSLLDVYQSRFVEALRDALRDITSNGLIISVTTGDELDTRSHHIQIALSDPDYTSGTDRNLDFVEGDKSSCRAPNVKILQEIGLDPEMVVIPMVPVCSRSQRLLFDKHRKLEDSHEQQNVRLVQQSTRQSFIELRSSSIVQPYADWSFLKGTPVHEQFVKYVLSGADEIFRNFGYKPTAKQAEDRATEDTQMTELKIKKAILAFGRRMQALNDWCSSPEVESRWSSFPSQAQSVIREIQNDKDSFEWEQRFLDRLINPDDVEEGWSQIALEPDTKEAIQQLIHQPTNDSMRSYGILKRGRIGGALLYGPPGTGKTHLARVLARESKSITICASAADLESKYVGETEKAIQGLFNLGQMLSPCTIFLDEADALFRSRKSDDTSWERSRVNQLLHEMDGLKKSKSPPFTLLATNFPNDLDSAVLRRVPSRIHIGLPSLEARQQMFRIYLAEEMLHPDVNLCHLAKRSQGYSGSDIQTVCVQAALICDTFIGDDARRQITNTHFDKAFQRSAPTVSQGALAKIRAFSKEYDPAALESREPIGKCRAIYYVDRDRFTSNGAAVCESGDKIAVLSNWDMPMVLRPNGEYYEVVGFRFVEGLVKTEVAAGMGQGLRQTEKLSLC